MPSTYNLGSRVAAAFCAFALSILTIGTTVTVPPAQASIVSSGVIA